MPAHASDRGVQRADLHTHSTASDGSLAPADLVRQASERGLAVLALTDHDTTLGLAEALRAGDIFGLRVIPGIELSTNVEPGEVHILGYGIDPGNDELQAMLTTLREAGLTRIVQIIERLRELGIDLPEGSVRPSAMGASVGRPHVARAMIEAGAVGSIAEAFDRYLGRGRPAYVPRFRLEPVDAVRLVRAAGGVPVLAHPFASSDFQDRLPALLEAGLMGVEAYYGEYRPEQREELARIAHGFGLLVTGGSDYHGEGFKEGRDLGSVPIPAEALDRFLECLEILERGRAD